MTRRHLAFACGGETLVGTLDTGNSPVGLLIVSGGSEARSGAQGNQAALASSVAEAGYPVFRFDRRGVGDATGTDSGFRSSAPDIAAALAAFREAVGLTRVVGYGNCDAASALMLQGGAGCDALLLANPWTFADDADDTPPPAAIRARYADKLRNPRELARLVSGGVSMKKLADGLARAVRPSAPPSTLAEELRAGFTGFPGPVRIVVAGRDRTGQAFRASLPDLACETCADAGHAFTEPAARAFLIKQLVAVLEEQTRQLDMR